MDAALFLLCPTDCLESIINKEYKGKNFFYVSLGNTFRCDAKTIETIEGLVLKHHIKDIYFVLSKQNKIISKAMVGQNYPHILGLQNFQSVIDYHKEQAKLFWNPNDIIFLTLSYFLNQKIDQLQQKLKSEFNQSVNIKGKIYLKAKNIFVDIYPNLVCLTDESLN